MATKTHPYNAKFAYSSDGNSYTNVADVMSITPPNITVGSGESTVLDSANAAKEFVPGWMDGGDASMSLRMGQAVLNTVYGFLRTTYYWKILFPLITGETNNSTWAFQGHITAFGNPQFGTDNDDPIGLDITIKVTGKPTFTASS